MLELNLVIYQSNKGNEKFDKKSIKIMKYLKYKCHIKLELELTKLAKQTTFKTETLSKTCQNMAQEKHVFWPILHGGSWKINKSL